MASRVPSSYISPKCSKGGRSAIEGAGPHALADISAGEVVAVKGGHVVDAATLRAEAKVIGDSDVQLTAQLYLVALTPVNTKG
jgi:uncharacterized protein